MYVNSFSENEVQTPLQFTRPFGHS